MQERSEQVIDAFSTMGKQQQESMVERLEKEEKMHQDDLAEQKAFRIAQEQSHDADRIAQDRQHEAFLLLEREKMQAETKRTQEKNRRFQQMEQRLQTCQDTTIAQQQELQLEVRQGQTENRQRQDNIERMLSIVVARRSQSFVLPLS
ncbi:unnamed protein product [Tilletia controversa]|nr:unnamed protein product [Tilletia controversa]CAD6922231.1 unnamed protein product [Tilletia controversa]CAD6980776.1 unnamed protein product [Tilletia controversa]